MESRRRFLQALMATGAISVAGCSGDGDGGDSGGDSGGSGGSAASSVEVTGITTVNIEDYSQLYETTDIEELNFTPASTAVGEFTSGVTQGPTADQFAVATQLSTMEDNFCGALKELNPDRIDRWDDIPSYLTDPKGSPNDPTLCDEEGKLVGMPMVANADSFVYNEEVTGELTSYGAMFDSEEWAGRVALEDNWATSLSKCALYLDANDMADIGEPSNMTPDEIEEVTDFLIERKSAGQFRAFWSGFEEAVSLIVSGDVDILDGWYPMVLSAQDQGLGGAAYADTEEGYHKWSIGGYLFDGEEGNQSGMEDAAYQYLNWSLSGEFGAQVVSQSGYVSASPAAQDYAQENSDRFDVDFIQQRYDDILLGKLEEGGYWTNRTPDNVDAYEQEWQRFKSA
jgi:putative spermidine/putrescine transport system substrate-binding protein